MVTPSLADRSVALAERTASLAELTAEIVACRACPRLVAWRELVAVEKVARFRSEEYWGRPVPGFGDPTARILIVGLAPAAHGGNRTGRVFTGDASGDFLFAALHAVGLASQADGRRADDGLALHDAYIAAAVRCAPPANKPTPTERATCQPFLVRELGLLQDVRVLVALGAIAWESSFRTIAALTGEDARPRPRFGHGAVARVGGYVVVGSYHPSQQNTFTKKLTQPMLREVLAVAGAMRGPLAGKGAVHRRTTVSAAHDGDAASFDAVAAIYATARPSYPQQAVDWLIPTVTGSIVDVGAGTGLFTRLLLERAPNVIAIEPSLPMLDALRAALPGVTALPGSGERIPLPDACADVVTFAQAWHWVDWEAASLEVARVLRPGGHLGLVWNLRDERIEWVRTLGMAMRADGDHFRGATEDPGVAAAFGQPERHVVEWVRVCSREEILADVRSRSYYPILGMAEQARVLGEVSEVLDAHGGGSDADRFELSYVTASFRYERP